MARIRTVKPQLFRHEILFNLEVETGLPIRFAWVGLFTCCDREGRFKWRPKELKLDILPWDDVDFEKVLYALESAGLIQRYQVDGEFYGHIPKWHEHQNINNREEPSRLPAFDESIHVSSTREARVDHASATREARGFRGREGKGRERKDASSTRHGPSTAGPLRPASIDQLCEILGSQFLKSLRDVYPDGQFLNKVISDAYLWAQSSGKKGMRTQDGWRRTITTWAKRDWDRHARSMPAERLAVNV